MIPLRVQCPDCGARTPLYVAAMGFHELICSGCGYWLTVEATPDAMIGKPRTLAKETPQRRWMPWIR